MPYRTTYARRPVQRTGPRANKYAANCSSCGLAVPAGTGLLAGSRTDGYTVHHAPARWHGSPISGGWVDGCPAATDKSNAALGHVGNAFVTNAASRAPLEPKTPRRSYAYTSGGARMTSRYGRCEDAPCCGCCD
jgi:hypothetical protein